MVYITRHAKKRLKERCGFNKKSMERMVERAYEKGLTQDECKGILKKYIDHILSPYNNANQIRIYGEKIYIFEDNRMITVINLLNEFKDLLKQTESDKVMEGERIL